MFKLLSLIQFAAAARKVVAELLSKTKSTATVEVVAAATNGKKTYLAAAGLVAYAVLGVMVGQMSVDVAVTLVLNGLGLASIRHAIQKFVDKFLVNDSEDPSDPDDPSASPALKIGPTPNDPASAAKKLEVDGLSSFSLPPSSLPLALAG